MIIYNSIAYLISLSIYIKINLLVRVHWTPSLNYVFFLPKRKIGGSWYSSQHKITSLSWEPMEGVDRLTIRERILLNKYGCSPTVPYNKCPTKIVILLFVSQTAPSSAAKKKKHGSVPRDKFQHPRVVVVCSERRMRSQKKLQFWLDFNEKRRKIVLASIVVITDLSFHFIKSRDAWRIEVISGMCVEFRFKSFWKGNENLFKTK